MNVLVLNGSPKGKKSNTLHLTKQFIAGMNEINMNTIELIDINKCKINHCLGCYNCWTKTPGKCIISDDMNELMEKYLEANIIIWSFPLYYYGMPSKIKAFLDRLLPLNQPFMKKEEHGRGTHLQRYDMKDKKYILISTCGFYSTNNNYEALIKQFEILYNKQFEKILCPEGELFSVEELKHRTDEYLENVFEAGKEYIKNFKISIITKNKLSELLYPEDNFIEMANASWEVSNNTNHSFDSKKNDESLKMLKQMKAIYNPGNSYKKDIILEFNFTDIQKKYQLKLLKDKCELITEKFEKFDTKIETTFKLWQEISKGKVDGAKAMLEKKYKIYGDFSIMTNLGTYFGKRKKEKQIMNKRKTKMLFNFLPFFAFWFLSSFDKSISAVITLIIVTGINFFSEKFLLTVYDRINMLCATILSIMVFLNFKISSLSLITYLILFAGWGISCFTNTPFTAHYSINAYENKEEMKKNPLFLKINKILTLVWTFVYLISALNIFIGNKFSINYTKICVYNTVLCVLMGYFTKWFIKWYPQKFIAEK